MHLPCAIPEPVVVEATGEQQHSLVSSEEQKRQVMQRTCTCQHFHPSSARAGSRQGEGRICSMQSGTSNDSSYLTFGCVAFGLLHQAGPV
jgi:hypothetical protein